MTVTVGRTAHRRLERVSRSQFDMWVKQSAVMPVAFISVGERRYWRFEGRWYWDNDGLGAEDVRALLVTRDQRRTATISRAKSTVAMAEAPQRPAARGAIPEDLKHHVWTRDSGCCRLCGSNVELQFDHIIPWSMGGATTEENLQVLCGPCNRRKGASVASPQRQRPAPTVSSAMPSAGWYPDPSGSAAKRYWDGDAWSAQTSAD